MLVCNAQHIFRFSVENLRCNEKGKNTAKQSTNKNSNGQNSEKLYSKQNKCRKAFSSRSCLGVCESERERYEKKYDRETHSQTHQQQRMKKI